MARVLIHACCPATKRSVAASLRELSGHDNEWAITLRSTAGGRARAWQTQQGYASNFWFGASQNLKASILLNLLDDSDIKGPEIFFVTYNELTGAQVRTNLPGWPQTNSWWSFLDYVGCTQIVVN